MNLNSKKYLENTICHCRNCHKKGTIISHCVRSSDQVETSITVIWRAQWGKKDTIRGGEFVLVCDKNETKLNPTKMI